MGINLVLCTRNKKWIHNKCSGVTGAMKDNTGFVRPRCADGTVMKKEIALDQERKF